MNILSIDNAARQGEYSQSSNIFEQNIVQKRKRHDFRPFPGSNLAASRLKLDDINAQTGLSPSRKKCQNSVD